MNVMTLKNKYGFYFMMKFNEKNYYTDSEIAILLSLSLEEYRNILNQYTSNQQIDNEYFFDNLDDINSAIEALQPYIIMANLTGE